MRHRLAILAILAIMATPLAVPLACGGGGYSSGGDPTSPPTTGTTVRAEPSLVFSPEQVTVTAGAVVTFAFGSVGHDVFFDPRNGAPADIPGVNANTSVVRTFSTPGTFRYTCHIHPGMQGSVVVKAPADEGY